MTDGTIFLLFDEVGNQVVSAWLTKLECVSEVLRLIILTDTDSTFTCLQYLPVVASVAA